MMPRRVRTARARVSRRSYCCNVSSPIRKAALSTASSSTSASSRQEPSEPIELPASSALVAEAAGIKASGASRVWVTSKIEACNNSVVRWGHCGADTAARFEDNLAQLGATSVDLMLLHAPTGTSASVYPVPPRSPSCNCTAPAACAAMQEQWAVLEKMYKAKKVRAIVVSNYCTACLDCIAAKSTVTPHVNQIRGEDAVAAAVAARIAAP